MMARVPAASASPVFARSTNGRTTLEIAFPSNEKEFDATNGSVARSLLMRPTSFPKKNPYLFSLMKNYDVTSGSTDEIRGERSSTKPPQSIRAPPYCKQRTKRRPRTRQAMRQLDHASSILPNPTTTRLIRRMRTCDMKARPLKLSLSQVQTESRGPPGRSSCIAHH